MNPETFPLSGSQTTLRHGPYTADVASIGASLRTLRHRGADLILPFGENEVRPAYRGAILAPWPNRVINGHYTFEGAEHQLGLSEPKRGHALHGLLVWQDWSVDNSTTASVTLSSTIPAQHGYPFRLDIQVSYELDESGMRTTVSARNTGTAPAPYGAAAHPYLVAGQGRVDDWVLELPAETVQQVSEDRLVPTGLHSVAGQPYYDFRRPRAIGSTRLDHAFTGLTRDGQGRTTVRLTAEDGTGTAMTWGPKCPWVQVHTADLPDPRASRRGLALEPMTCPPGAFNTGTDLIVLGPGESHSAQWTISAIRHP